MNTLVSLTLKTRTMLCAGFVVLLASCGGGGEADTQASQPAQAGAAAYAALAGTADLYVSTTGSDSNGGTQAAPFKTIAKAAKAALPGTTVHVQAGTYTGGFQTTASGTASARIRYVSDTRLGAKIIPAANSLNNTGWDNRGAYVDIDGFEVDGGAYQSGTKWLYGIYTAGAYDLITHNHVHHIGNTATCVTSGGGGIGADSYYNGVGIDVLANIVHDVGPTGCVYFHGIYVNTAASHVSNNLIYNIAEAGIKLWRDATKGVIANNTIFNSNSGIVVGAGDYYKGSGPNDYTHVLNNIIYNNKYSLVEVGYTGIHNSYTNNLIYKNTYNWMLQNGLTPTSTVTAAPQFANDTGTAAGDYHLQSTSPAIGKGTSIDAPGTDLDGNVRSASNGYDIGAYQRAGAPAPAPAPAPTPTPTPTPTPATTYNFYVSPTGSDSNPGTQSAPFRSILRASQAALPDSTIRVAPGTYPGGFKTTVNGTAAGRIHFLSSVKWGAKIVPPANSVSNTAWDNRGNYIDIDGFDIDGGISQSGTVWFNGIYMGGSYGVVKNNHVHHIANKITCTSKGGSGINTDHYYYGVNNDVIGNVVHHIGTPNCGYVQGVYISTSGNVKNNLIYQIDSVAIHLWHDATNVNIANNTVFSSYTGILVGSGDYYHGSGPADYVNVSNNIVFDNINGVSEQGKTGTHNTYTNNLVYQNSGINWKLQNGLTHSADVTGNPQFVSYIRTGGGDYHLGSSSPAINKGSVTYGPLTDLDGNVRPQGGAMDIGAYEYMGN